MTEDADHLTAVPSGVMSEIVRYLDRFDLCALRSTCARMKEMVDLFWTPATRARDGRNAEYPGECAERHLEELRRILARVSPSSYGRDADEINAHVRWCMLHEVTRSDALSAVRDALLAVRVSPSDDDPPARDETARAAISIAAGLAACGYPGADAEVFPALASATTKLRRARFRSHSGCDVRPIVLGRTLRTATFETEENARVFYGIARDLFEHLSTANAGAAALDEYATALRDGRRAPANAPFTMKILQTVPGGPDPMKLLIRLTAYSDVPWKHPSPVGCSWLRSDFADVVNQVPLSTSHVHEAAKAARLHDYRAAGILFGLAFGYHPLESRGDREMEMLRIGDPEGSTAQDHLGFLAPNRKRNGLWGSGSGAIICKRGLRFVFSWASSYPPAFQDRLWRGLFDFVGCDYPEHVSRALRDALARLKNPCGSTFSTDLGDSSDALLERHVVTPWVMFVMAVEAVFGEDFDATEVAGTVASTLFDEISNPGRTRPRSAPGLDRLTECARSAIFASKTLVGQFSRIFFVVRTDPFDREPDAFDGGRSYARFLAYLDNTRRYRLSNGPKFSKASLTRNPESIERCVEVVRQTFVAFSKLDPDRYAGGLPPTTTWDGGRLDFAFDIGLLCPLEAIILVKNSIARRRLLAQAIASGSLQRISKVRFPSDVQTLLAHLLCGTKSDLKAMAARAKSWNSLLVRLDEGMRCTWRPRPTIVEHLKAVHLADSQQHRTANRAAESADVFDHDRRKFAVKDAVGVDLMEAMYNAMFDATVSQDARRTRISACARALEIAYPTSGAAGAASSSVVETSMFSFSSRKEAQPAHSGKRKRGD